MVVRLKPEDRKVSGLWNFLVAITARRLRVGSATLRARTFTCVSRFGSNATTTSRRGPTGTGRAYERRAGERPLGGLVAVKRSARTADVANAGCLSRRLDRCRCPAD